MRIVVGVSRRDAFDLRRAVEKKYRQCDARLQASNCTVASVEKLSRDKQADGRRRSV